MASFEAPLRDGSTMHVHVVGRGPTVVMLHGFAMEGRSWLHSVAPLARRYRFVMPDLRGFGRSHRVPYAKADVIEGFADDLEDLLDHLGDKKVFLAGLSMGALTSAAFAARGGFERVSGYVHVDQAARIHNADGYEHGLFGRAQAERFATLRGIHADVAPYRDGSFEQIPPALRLKVRDAFAAFFRDAFHAPWLKTACTMVTRESLMKHVVPLERWSVYIDCMKAYLDGRHDYSAGLAKAHAAHPVPLTFMVGDRSEMYPAAGQLDLAKLVKSESSRPERVEVVRFERSGHAVPIESPVRFVRELGRALARAEA